MKTLKTAAQAHEATEKAINLNARVEAMVNDLVGSIDNAISLGKFEVELTFSELFERGGIFYLLENNGYIVSWTSDSIFKRLRITW